MCNFATLYFEDWLRAPKTLCRAERLRRKIISLGFHQDGLTISYIRYKDDQGKNEITSEMRKKISLASPFA